jgi:hypothetical protein
MQTDYFEQCSATLNTLLNSFKDFGELNTKYTEKFIQHQFDFASACVEASVKQMNLISEAKGYKDLLSGQAALWADYNEKVIDNLRKGMGTVSESRDEITAWVEKGVEATVTPLRKVTPAAKKASA